MAKYLSTSDNKCACYKLLSVVYIILCFTVLWLLFVMCVCIVIFNKGTGVQALWLVSANVMHLCNYYLQ